MVYSVLCIRTFVHSVVLLVPIRGHERGIRDYKFIKRWAHHHPITIVRSFVAFKVNFPETIRKKKFFVLPQKMRVASSSRKRNKQIRSQEWLDFWLLRCITQPPPQIQQMVRVRCFTLWFSLLILNAKSDLGQQQATHSTF